MKILSFTFWPGSHDASAAIVSDGELARTGVPVILNTSFNGAGEPIVCTPDDAVRTFLATRLDALILGDFLVTRANVD